LKHSIITNNTEIGVDPLPCNAVAEHQQITTNQSVSTLPR